VPIPIASASKPHEGRTTEVNAASDPAWPSVPRSVRPLEKAVGAWRWRAPAGFLCRGCAAFSGKTSNRLSGARITAEERRIDAMSMEVAAASATSARFDAWFAERQNCITRGLKTGL
jgi:hypothetical protein